MIREGLLLLAEEGRLLAHDTFGDGLVKSAAALVGMTVAWTLTGLLLRGGGERA